MLPLYSGLDKEMDAMVSDVLENRAEKIEEKQKKVLTLTNRYCFICQVNATLFCIN